MSVVKINLLFYRFANIKHFMSTCMTIYKTNDKGKINERLKLIYVQ